MKKKKVFLSIDTSDTDETRVAITFQGTIYEKKGSMGQLKSQRLLPLLKELLKELNLTPKDITEIKVVTGPGSFTGLRVGIAIANTLGFLLSIPINGKKDFLVDLQYE